MRKLLSKIDVEFICFWMNSGDVITKRGENTIIYGWLMIIGVKKMLPLQYRYTNFLYMMKIKRLLVMAVLLLPVSMMAQMKIATVDVQAIFAAMPESADAKAELDKASQQYKAEYELMQAEFNRKYDAYQSMSANKDVPATIRERRIREIQDSDREIEQFLTRSKQQLEAQKRELEAPIYSKISQAIKQVGNDGGYTYIIDVSKTPVVYSGSGAMDLTGEVKKLLDVN